MNHLVLGCGSKKAKNVNRAQILEFQAFGVPLKAKVAEFAVTPDAMLPVGTELGAAHFAAGQFVDITGTTRGKGFQGNTSMAMLQPIDGDAAWASVIILVQCSWCEGQLLWRPH